MGEIAIKIRVVAGIVLIPAKIGELEGEVALDSGAMRTALNVKYFPDADGEGVDVVRFHGGLGDARAAGGRVPLVELPGWEVRDLPVITMDLDYVEAALRTVEPGTVFLGSLGYDVLRGHVLLVDYGGCVLTVDPEIDVSGLPSVPLASAEPLPTVELEVAGERRPFVLDTGANTCLVSSELAGAVPCVPDPETPGVVRLTVGLAGREFSDVPAVFADVSHIRSVNADGVIGYALLSPAPAVLDFPGGRVYFTGRRQ